jgi:hypothetical protein
MQRRKLCRYHPIVVVRLHGVSHSYLHLSSSDLRGLPTDQNPIRKESSSHVAMQKLERDSKQEAEERKRNRHKVSAESNKRLAKRKDKAASDQTYPP